MTLKAKHTELCLAAIPGEIRLYGSGPSGGPLGSVELKDGSLLESFLLTSNVQSPVTGRHASHAFRYDGAVEAEFNVELGRGDPVLDVPWSSDTQARYYDLKAHPESLDEIEEARRYPELQAFLSFLNSPATPLQSAKCDAWVSDEIDVEEEIFGGKCKFGSYVDALFSDTSLQTSFPAHEQLARNLVELLKSVPEIPAAAEFIVRRCYYHDRPQETRDGFYITGYVLGFGADAEQSRARWAIALQLVENALRQLLSRREESAFGCTQHSEKQIPHG